MFNYKPDDLSAVERQWHLKHFRGSIVAQQRLEAYANLLCNKANRLSNMAAAITGLTEPYQENPC